MKLVVENEVVRNCGVVFRDEEEDVKCKLRMSFCCMLREDHGGVSACFFGCFWRWSGVGMEYSVDHCLEGVLCLLLLYYQRL